jgi:hypothetical protein
MLKQNISLNDIKIYDIGHQFGDTGYNISDLLNMPYYWAGWVQEPHASYQLYKTAQETAAKNPNTILGKYYSTRSKDEKIPNLLRINDIIDNYIIENEIKKLNINSYIHDKYVLFVHVRSGDYGVISSNYLNAIQKLSRIYKIVILLSGVNRSDHEDEEEDSEHNILCRENLLKSLKLVLKLNVNIYVYFDIPDTHICIMRLCKNLLIHKGGYSVLGSFINNNNIFYTNELQCRDNLEWVNNTKYKNIVHLI